MASSKLREPADEVFGKFCLALSLAKATWPLVWGDREESLGDFSVCVCEVCMLWSYRLILCHTSGHGNYNSSNINKDPLLISAVSCQALRQHPHLTRTSH